MTTRPELDVGSHLVPGLAAVALFAVMASIFLTASFEGGSAGFPADASVVASIGRAMFDLSGGIAHESFLIAFETVDLVLVAALAGAVLLARREEGGSTVALLADGGRELYRTVRGDDRGAETADTEGGEP